MEGEVFKVDYILRLSQPRFAELLPLKININGDSGLGQFRFYAWESLF